MIWDVKIFLAKIKDCKGKDLIFLTKKKLPTKIPPNPGEKPFSAPVGRPRLREILNSELEGKPAGTDRGRLAIREVSATRDRRRQEDPKRSITSGGEADAQRVPQLRRADGSAAADQSA